MAILHADHHRLLADVEVAEAADQPHAVELRRPLLEAADQQHLAIGGKLLLAAEGGDLSAGRWDETMSGRSTFVAMRGLRSRNRTGNAASRPAAAVPRCTCQLSGQRLAVVGEAVRLSRGRRRRRRARPRGRPGARSPAARSPALRSMIGIAGVEQAHVPLQAGADGLEALDLRLQLPGAFDQSTRAPRGHAYRRWRDRRNSPAPEDRKATPGSAAAGLCADRTWSATRDLLMRPTGTRGKSTRKQLSRRKGGRSSVRA